MSNEPARLFGDAGLIIDKLSIKAIYRIQSALNSGHSSANHIDSRRPLTDADRPVYTDRQAFVATGPRH